MASIQIGLTTNKNQGTIEVSKTKQKLPQKHAHICDTKAIQCAHKDPTVNHNQFN